MPVGNLRHIVTGADDIVENLRQVEERLRELAYERLRDAAADGDAECRGRRAQDSSKPTGPCSGRSTRSGEAWTTGAGA